ncbi:S1 RNA-binding domain-containing protein [Veillonella sp. YH-vei2232]|jgi:S1 RNA binding domain protein|uniref:S1 RNA-binding domain-containing protein n=1 Tax=Veillonella absiana TaxID=3079305 RepID=A0ABU3Z9R4_9FIRM|nr:MULTISPECIES: S1 RNA-binding domain-containing protein [unclassified Veillonella]NCB95127.1 S1 RNA-binding domain-containing protein [Negativicutes bacterium]MBP6923512.1 S1 RNA-binding domain-containing protein [Veillonella sp.]MBP9550642.1 S1 RNA-binding domain-containing protein [Veillonella sp.]MDV5063182.1 S1 RNA-binding domain-containing protein [Veillonella sp. YH-vei2232]MDV5088658.1 S1 RNA-binding domain-containing protein [Veillonella sp. YH-vei2233]
MAIEVGNILDGTVTGITKFGVFVDLGEKQTGLVHISEVAHGYVEDINDVLKVQDPVKVKILSIEGNKIGLSIKQTQAKPQSERPRERSAKSFPSDRPKFSNDRPKFNSDRPKFEQGDRPQERRESNGNREYADRPRRANNKQSSASFEEKMKMFLKDSDERLHDLKRNTESKRGGRGGRRE